MLNRAQIVKILKALLEIDDLELIKCTLESIIEDLEDLKSSKKPST